MIAYAFYEGNARIQQYATALAKRGDRVDVIALRGVGEPRHRVSEGVQVYGIQRRALDEKSRWTFLYRVLRFLVHAAFVVTRQEFSEPYDLIHVHSVPDFLVYAALVPKLMGASVILDIHDILPEFYASKFEAGQKSYLFRLMLLVERVSIAFADHVIIANHLWQERLLSRSVSAGKCTAIRNHPNIQLFRPDLRNRDDRKFRITYPGSLNWHQGLDVALRSFAQIAEAMPDAEFHIIGDGPARPELMSLAAQLGLDGRIIFRDSVPTAQVAIEMANSDLAVVPKRASSPFGNEAASTKIMEFMAAGVPIVVSRTKVDTYYHDDSMVKFFESENESDLARCILELWRDADGRRRLVANATKYAQQNNWDVKKFEYLILVDSLVAAKQKRSKSAASAHVN